MTNLMEDFFDCRECSYYAFIILYSAAACPQLC